MKTAVIVFIASGWQQREYITIQMNYCKPLLAFEFGS
jgi:hypothetical protein